MRELIEILSRMASVCAVRAIGIIAMNEKSRTNWSFIYIKNIINLKVLEVVSLKATTAATWNSILIKVQPKHGNVWHALKCRYLFCS